ncbi:hypothetical protein SAMN05216364_103510 [Porphyromonadaceae bacterium KHP3R9]|jgi:hypothetical protein|nr:hypothetical protein SAMN05216364_103510 [Porphyromonadaceae bacterium KHP3R9]
MLDSVKQIEMIVYVEKHSSADFFNYELIWIMPMKKERKTGTLTV